MSEHKRKTAAAAVTGQKASAEETPESYRETKSEQKGVFLKGADYLLSRLPFTKYKYQYWSKTKRIVMGYLLWLIVLPVIPLAILVIWYVRDPEGFKKSKLMPALVMLTIAWFGGGLGYVSSQVPVDTADGKVSKSAQANVEDKTTSEPTAGRRFENCTEAFKAGVFDIPYSDPSYERRLDRDGDRVACEK